MGGALAQGILGLDYIKPENIYIYDVSEEKRFFFSKYGVSIASNIYTLVDNCEYIFFA